MLEFYHFDFCRGEHGRHANGYVIPADAVIGPLHRLDDQPRRGHQVPLAAGQE